MQRTHDLPKKKKKKQYKNSSEEAELKKTMNLKSPIQCSMFL